MSLRDARGIKERCAQTLHGGLQGPSGEPPVTHELPDGAPADRLPFLLSIMRHLAVVRSPAVASVSCVTVAAA